jgi:hypothetical protein
MKTWQSGGSDPRILNLGRDSFMPQPLHRREMAPRTSLEAAGRDETSCCCLVVRCFPLAKRETTLYEQTKRPTNVFISYNLIIGDS